MLNPYPKKIILTVFALAAFTLGIHQASAQDDYYDENHETFGLFNPFPRTDSSNWTVRSFGPVGIGLELIRPGMTMRIKNVEPGSPADLTGQLMPGQIIESINGVTLEDIDPRMILGNIITQAEATDGKYHMQIQGGGVVTVQTPVMGSYSPTWPLNCPKSDKIVRDMADALAQLEAPSWGAVIFLLSTGDEGDLEVVKNWMKNADSHYGSMNWEAGYAGLGLCEYYLRTGDESVLPVIKRMSDQLRDNMYSGGWSGRGAPAKFTYSSGSGQVHASGVNCMSFLMMAKLCGVEVDDYTMKRSWKQFYRYAGHANVPYGNTYPEGGFRDNGKTSGLAYALAAATMLHPNGENSIYAKARDNSSMKAFYATNWFHAAHTGGGMGEIWHHTAINKMREKRPTQYRSYLDTRRWVMELSRRHDGTICIAGMDDRYNRSLTDSTDGRDWGTFFALTYTLPRKHLQIFGAPRSPYAVEEAVPVPWGNKADELYHSIEPIPGGTLTIQDLLNETVENGSSVPFFRVTTADDVTDETLLKYLHHPEYGLREATMRELVKKGRYHLILPLLKHSDTRLRQCGLLAITGMFKGSAISNSQLTPEMMAEVSKMVMDKDESWWTALFAIRALGRADKATIGNHRDRLLEFLTDYDSPWLETDASLVLTKIAVEPEHYRVVLPALLDKTSKFRVDNASKRSSDAIAHALQGASPEIRRFACPYAKAIVASVPDPVTEPHTGAIFGDGTLIIRERMEDIKNATGFILDSPNGGENWPQSSVQTISWCSAGEGNVSIQYIKGANAPVTIVASTPDDGSYAWAIPSNLELGSDYIIRITSGASLSSIQSEGHFSITPSLPRYNEWSAGNSSNSDPNGDGIKNSLAWALGAASPNENAIPLLPTFSETDDPNVMSFNYRRSDAANADPNTSVSVLYTTDLLTWNTAIDNGFTIRIFEDDDFYGAGVDRVRVELSRILGDGGRLFSRLHVDVSE